MLAKSTPTTQADLDAKAERQVKQLHSWVRYCNALIETKVEDAKAHAVNAVTKAVRSLPEGRLQAAKARRHPSAQAAVARLDELTEALAGPSIRSHLGTIRDARATFYRDAFDEWKLLIDSSLWRSPDPTPVQGDLLYLRGLPLHGLDPRAVVAGKVDSAKRSLVAAIARTASHLSPEAGKTMIPGMFLDVWETQTKASILAMVKTLLSDGQMAADRLAGRDLIHPDHLDDTPLEIGQ